MLLSKTQRGRGETRRNKCCGNLEGHRTGRKLNSTKERAQFFQRESVHYSVHPSASNLAEEGAQLVRNSDQP